MDRHFYIAHTSFLKKTRKYYQHIRVMIGKSSLDRRWWSD